MLFDDGLSGVIAVVMRCGINYPTARAIVHALRDAGCLP